jgi:CRISPR-associated protein Cst2
MVDIVGHDQELHNVNAISGDMLKHVQMEHFYQLVRDRQVALCQSCQRFNTNRINADQGFIERTKDLSDVEVIDLMLKTCAIDDIAGILITEGKRSIPRKSIVEFGWALGLPDKVRTDSYFHVKYVTERSADKRAADADGQKSGANLGQNIFHRPASSGVYALVCHLELARIGYNDIKQFYAISEEERQLRASLLLESLLYTFIELNGAMRSTQLPHLTALEGVLTTSTGVIPAPLVSPLAGGGDDPDMYRAQAEGIVAALNGSEVQMVKAHSFNTLSDFASQMRTLIDSSTPFALAVGR